MSILNLKEIKKVHCIGVGGIGVSAIARMMLQEGKVVSGSDPSASPVTEGLIKEGVTVFNEHNKTNISSDIDLVVYTTAIQENNPELLESKRLNIPTFTYPEMLGEISTDKYTVAVSGTHGKTTTTGMISDIFIEANYKPTIIVGSLLRKNKTNFISGDSKYFIVEACEYRRSFLNLHPDILVITNIDADHLDYYKDITDIQDAFRELALRVPTDGFIVCDPKDSKIVPVIKELKCNIVNYQDYTDSVPKMKVFGKHNRKNASAAMAVAKCVDIKSDVTNKSLSEFSGTWRRSEFKGKLKSGALVFDDYAHHPTEIKATLDSFKEEYPHKKIIFVFQPHLFSRTKQLFNDFKQVLGDADQVIITDVYAAREKGGNENLSEKLAGDIKNGVYCSSFSNVITMLEENTSAENVVVTMGAGDIYTVADQLVK